VKKESHASALFKQALEELSQETTALRGALAAGNLTKLMAQYSCLDPATLAEAAVNAGARRRSAHGLALLVRSFETGVPDPFQRAELGRLAAHLIQIADICSREKRLISGLQDTNNESAGRQHLRELAEIADEHRKQRAALEHAINSVSLNAPVVGHDHHAVQSRIIVALYLTLLREALAFEQQADHVLLPFNDETTPSQMKGVEQQVGAAKTAIAEFAKGY